MTYKEMRQRKRRMEREAISEKLRDAYEKSGLTVQEISRITGHNYNTLTAWFCGNRTPKKATAELVIAKIKTYFEHDDRAEYIDKKGCRSLFIDRVYQVFTSKNPEQLGKDGAYLHSYHASFFSVNTVNIKIDYVFEAESDIFGINRSVGVEYAHIYKNQQTEDGCASIYMA